MVDDIASGQIWEVDVKSPLCWFIGTGYEALDLGDKIPPYERIRSSGLVEGSNLG